MNSSSFPQITAIPTKIIFLPTDPIYFSTNFVISLTFLEVQGISHVLNQFLIFLEAN
jgi:hypothetical protein